MRAKYVLSEVMIGLWRNVTMTIAMIITMTVSLAMLGATFVMYHQIDQQKQTFVANLSVSVYMDKTTLPPDQQALADQVKQDPLVASAQLITQDMALAEFTKLQGSQYPDLVGVTSAHDLPPSVRVKLKNANDFDKFKAQFTSAAHVTSVQNQADLLTKVFKVLGAMQNLALVLAVAQGLAALLLVANTIQVAAYSKRREVAVMKLVGASNWFIQAPFVLEAMFAGILGAVLAWIALVAAKMFLIDGSLKALTLMLGNVEWSTINLMLVYLVAAGALVSGVTGWITLRVYIKK
jgi:cell division transport system permease protein